MSEQKRTQLLKKKILNAPYEICIERARYFAYFIDLGKSVQDDIINRTEFYS